MEKTKIQQLADSFLNKENYELQLRIAIDKIVKENTSALNSLNEFMSTDKIKVFKILMAVSDFQAKIDNQIIELKNHYDSKLDIVGSSIHKAEYIYLENVKINELITTIHKIIKSYGINKISYKKNAPLIDENVDYKLPFDNDISNGILSSIVAFTESFLNNTDAIVNAIINAPIFNHSIDEILVETLVISIKKINMVSLHILKNNRNVFDDTYQINGNDYIIRLTKIATNEKTVNTLIKSETEIISSTTKSTHELKDSISKNDAKQNKLWFHVGLLFANGEMDNLISKHDNQGTPNCTAIAKELGNKNFRPYISESYSGTNQDNKNIFSNQDKVSYILNYCENKGIPVVDKFKQRIKTQKNSRY